MPPVLALPAPDPQSYLVRNERVSLVTRHRVEFIDITDLVIETVARSGITDGTVNVQTLHTTTAVRINENETRLLEDLQLLFERLAPRSRRWLHDDLEARQGPLAPDESRNGDAHARAILLGTGETLNIVEGTVQLGAWQRVFLIELDGCRRRSVSMTVAGIAADLAAGSEPVDLRSVS